MFRSLTDIGLDYLGAHQKLSPNFLSGLDKHSNLIYTLIQSILHRR